MEGTTLTAGIESLQVGAKGLGKGLNSASNQLNQHQQSLIMQKYYPIL